VRSRRLVEDHGEHLALQRTRAPAGLRSCALRALIAGVGLEDGSRVPPPEKSERSVKCLMSLVMTAMLIPPPAGEFRLDSRALPCDAAPSASRISSSPTISGGSRRTTLSPAGTVSSFGVPQRLGNTLVLGWRQLEAEHQPGAADFLDHFGELVGLSWARPCLRQQSLACDLARGSPSPAPRRARHCRPPWRADCRRRWCRARRRHAGGSLLGGQAGAHRETAADALGDRHQIRARRRRAHRRTACRSGRCRTGPRRRPAAGRARRRARAAASGWPSAPSAGRPRPAPARSSSPPSRARSPPSPPSHVVERNLVEAVDLRAEAVKIFLPGRRRRWSPACGHGRRPRR
jgi:hypothetical protein